MLIINLYASLWSNGQSVNRNQFGVELITSATNSYSMMPVALRAWQSEFQHNSAFVQS